MATDYLMDTYELVEVIDALPRFEPFLLNAFFPRTVTFNSREIIFDKLSEDLRLAPFVSPVVEGKVMKDIGGAVKSFRPAYIKPKHSVDPDQVFKRRPGEALGGSLSPQQRHDAIVAANLEMERNAIIRRWEWMAAQVMLTGSITVSGEDYPTSVVDFGRAGALTKVLTLGTRWSEATATPIQDLEAWAALLEAPPNVVIMDAMAFSKFIMHEDVQKYLDVRRGTAITLSMDPDNGSLTQYRGMIGPFSIYIYSGYYHDSSMARQPFLPANTVIMASAALQGIRAFGAIISARAGYQPLPIYPRNWISDNVEIEYTESQSAPLMVPLRPDASIAVTVA